MKHTSIFLITLFVFSTVTTLQAGPPKGFVALFNGKNLDGWQAKKNGWAVEDGVLVRKPGSGYIWTKKSFGDFVLDLEVKVSSRCNSGIFFRTDPKNAVQGGFEIQIASPGIYGGKHVVGSLYDAKEPVAAAGKPDGEWNTMEVTCKGPSIKVVLNAKPVIDVDIDDWKEPRKNPDGSKNKFKTALKDLPRTGHFGLQYHGQPVWFRNIKVTPLK